MPALASALRTQLENTVTKARVLAEAAARAGLTALGVESAAAPAHLTPAQRSLRTRLRARGQQLGDERKGDGSQGITHLVWDTAYEHWHQMLFARFLAENDLLMHPDGVAVTLADCAELVADPAEARGATTAAQLAAIYATAMLPQIFRPQDPVLAVPFAKEHQKPLEQLVENLPTAVFTADDSLGWVYQFWQAKRKEEVNASEVKIGADELPAVTQLFTEPYMVQFLLHNSLGAWWAAKRLSPALLASAGSEVELRTAAAADLGGYEFTYLRFIRGDGGAWTPAAGTFPLWPVAAKDITTLDPCCGSGHFLVALLQLLARLRMAEEGLSPAAACDAVLRDNLHGLEIDPRCTQIAAFAVALAAWTFPDSGGFRPLPSPHIACSGLRVAAKREEWMALADRVGGTERERLREGMGRLWDTFQQAPVLGSLLDPGQATGQTHLFTAGWDELQPLLTQALSDERLFDDEDRREIGVAARGLADAARLLTNHYQLVITNVPYLSRNKQSEKLQQHVDLNYPLGSPDLATVFILRCLDFSNSNGIVALVAPVIWATYTKDYEKLRYHLLTNYQWGMIGGLGKRAFTTISGEIVDVVLLQLNKSMKAASHFFRVDATEGKKAQDKADLFLSVAPEKLSQAAQINNPGHSIATSGISASLSKYATAHEGLSRGDAEQFDRCFWEIEARHLSEKWKMFIESPSMGGFYAGRSTVMLWEGGTGRLAAHSSARIQGLEAWGKKAVVVSRTHMNATLSAGSAYAQNCVSIVPHDEADLAAIYLYCSSSNYRKAVLNLNQKLVKPTGVMDKTPIEIEYWRKLAVSTFSDDLPQPHSLDPSQWYFSGHVVSGERSLQVGLARLLGYRWPMEIESNVKMDEGQRKLSNQCEAFSSYADADGIVGLSALSGERPAAERLRDLLAAAYGTEWSATIEAKLLAHDDARTLDDWLRDKAFAGHVKLFRNRPFLWHVWDGRKDGFHVFVNYHKLDARLLERLIHTYLGDWITRQEADAAAGKAGADLRLAAALALRAKLLAIHGGEQPFDIFVRWKPLHEQPIGWNPDLNDGVRLNIRPWIEADVLRMNLKTKIKYGIDRGKDPAGSPWGAERDNDRHLTLAEKHAARAVAPGGRS